MQTTNPWITIWVSPRLTVKEALKNDIHKRAALLLAIFFGGLTSFWFARQETLVLAYTGNLLPLVFTVMVGAITGPLLYYGFGYAFGQVGSWYNGNGDVAATRKAFVYALFMPGILVGLANLIMFMLALIELQFQTSILFYVVQVGSVLIDLSVVWVFMIFLIAYSEAQSIGLWRALLVVVAIIGCLTVLFIGVDLISNGFR